MDSPESIVSSLDPEDNEVHYCKKCSKVSNRHREPVVSTHTREGLFH